MNKQTVFVKCSPDEAEFSIEKFKEYSSLIPAKELKDVYVLSEEELHVLPDGKLQGKWSNYQYNDYDYWFHEFSVEDLSKDLDQIYKERKEIEEAEAEMKRQESIKREQDRQQQEKEERRRQYLELKKEFE